MIRVLLLLLAVCKTTFGDSFLPAEPGVFSSPAGKYLVRIEAADSVKDARGYWKQTEFNVFAYDEKTEAYQRLVKFNVEGHPLRLFVNDAGTHVVTIDQHFGVGYGQIAAIYSMDGKRLAEWKLTDFFGAQSLYDLRGPLRDFRRSTSSIYWRGDAGWNRDQKSIWIAAPKRIDREEDGSAVRLPDLDSYVIDLDKIEMKRVTPNAADQPATRGGKGQ